MATHEEIWGEVGKIPPGKVMTYKQVAEKLGTAPIVVGRAMHAAYKKEINVPWWRVLKKVNGRNNQYACISPRAPEHTQNRQRNELTAKDRIKFDEKGHVDLGQYGVP